MLESSKNLRAIFPKSGQQRQLLEKVIALSSVDEVAKVCSCTSRTIRDWRREKFRMNYSCLLNVCKKYNLEVPIITTEDQFAHNKEAGKKGGKALIKKYGKVPVSELERKKCWQKWWEADGQKQSKITKPKNIVIPVKSEKLAEFIGIVMGDGTIAPYHVAITLDSFADKDYIPYVNELAYSLFGVQPKIHNRSDCRAVNVVIARKNLVEYLISLGLPQGNKIKQGLSIPGWLKNNQNYALACVRGLVDTDGSIFTHKYRSNGKYYSYKKLAFTSASKQLRTDVAEILSKSDITIRHVGMDIRIDSKDSIEQYFDLVGSSNPKHLKRWTK